MEAPDKIYIQPNAHDRWFEGNKPNDNFVEYVRKDALVPDNLDDAAREIVIKMHPSLKDCTILGDRLTRGQLMTLVKAGAEWMAEQKEE